MPPPHRYQRRRGSIRRHAADGAGMDTPDENGRTLRDLPDPDFIALWARERLQLALGTGSRAAYDAAHQEYERRLGRAS
jgi:hypothetical protein